MTDQLSLDMSPRPMVERIARVNAKRPGRKTIDERCAEFDVAHPEVYAELRRLALEAVRRGRRRIGIAQLVEVARWNLATSAKADGYKINNDFRSRWARRLSAECPELRDVFEIREVRTP